MNSDAFLLSFLFLGVEPAAAAVLPPPVGFEEQLPPVSSASQSMVAYFFVKISVYDDLRQLWVQDNVAKKSQLVYRYARNATVAFSPNDRLLAVSDESGSDLTETLLFERSRDGLFRRSKLDLTRSAHDAFKKAYRLESFPNLMHSYCVAREWSKDSKNLYLSVSGHTDIDNYIESWGVIVNVTNGKTVVDPKTANSATVILGGAHLRVN